MDTLLGCRTPQSTVLLSSMDDYPAVNQVYGEFFQAGNAPARAAFGWFRLP
jgi:enamine deaminase RidA (YjgF/YER057c/UK114 family)